MILEETVFLRAILDAPDDDAPRLAFADWLDEHGGPIECEVCENSGCNRLANGEIDTAWYCPVCDGQSNGFAARAEFIRVQCEAEHLDRIVQTGIFAPGPPSNAPDTSKEFGRLCDLRRRERELMDYHWRNWCDSLPAPIACSNLNGQSDTLTVTFRRGFVASVALPLAAFLGGSCGRCGGQGDRSDASLCPACYGTGRTPGLAASLFASMPLTAVRLTDREPWDGRYWHNMNRSRNRSEPADYGRSDLPQEVWDQLDGFDICTDRFKRFSTNVAAIEALVSACVKYGRSLSNYTHER